MWFLEGCDRNFLPHGLVLLVDGRRRRWVAKARGVILEPAKAQLVLATLAVLS